jgi:FkbM family methyltransferase
MLIKLDHLVKKYFINFKGILHVGAHDCEEIKDYEKYISRDKILWIEAMPEKVLYNKNKYPNLLIEQAIVSNEEIDVEFKYSNNGQSSSILELGKHAEHYPSIFFIKTLNQKSKLLKNIISNYNIDFNFINLDIQGAELLALIGYGDYLNNIDYIYTEVNDDYVYKNCALITDLDEYLSKYNFIRYDTKFTDFNWGDAFYIKANLFNRTLNNCDALSNGELFLYNKIKNKIKVIFDVGCRNDSLFLNFNGDVHYFDPNINELEELKTKINNNNLSIYNNFALSNSNSDSIYFPNTQSLHDRKIGKLYKHKFDSDLIIIKKDTGKNYIKNTNINEIDFLKIDTEGHEMNVLIGFEEEIKKCKLIQFEYGGTFKEVNVKFIDIINYLKSYDFIDYAYLSNDGYIKINDFNDHYCYCNIICFNSKYGTLDDFMN